MKEMTWTRDEALKRLAMAYQATKHVMEASAIEAATAPERRLQERLFAEACEKRDVMIGILMSAETLGIGKEEISDMEVSKEEIETFMDAFHEACMEKTKKRMPENLGKILADVFG